MHLTIYLKLEALNKSSDATGIVSSNHSKLYLHFPSRTTRIDIHMGCEDLDSVLFSLRADEKRAAQQQRHKAES